MPSELFRFKQFDLLHGEGYKIGTDAVLLGSWAGSDPNIKRILDLGSGTGVIGFLLAQRFPKAQVHLLERNEAAVQECHANIARSPFADRIQCIHADVLDWKNTEPYDLVVSNPPYFASALPSSNPQKVSAKHISSEDQIKWFEKMEELVNQEDGKIALVLSNKHLKAQKNALPVFSSFQLNRKLAVSHRPHSNPSLLLLEYGKEETKSEDQWSILSSNGSFSDEYSALCKDFLLSVK